MYMVGGGSDGENRVKKNVCDEITMRCPLFLDDPAFKSGRFVKILGPSLGNWLKGLRYEKHQKENYEIIELK